MNPLGLIPMGQQNDLPGMALWLSNGVNSVAQQMQHPYADRIIAPFEGDMPQRWGPTYVPQTTAPTSIPAAAPRMPAQGMGYSSALLQALGGGQAAPPQPYQLTPRPVSPLMQQLVDPMINQEFGPLQAPNPNRYGHGDIYSRPPG